MIAHAQCLSLFDLERSTSSKFHSQLAAWPASSSNVPKAMYRSARRSAAGYSRICSQQLMGRRNARSWLCFSLSRQSCRPRALALLKRRSSPPKSMSYCDMIRKCCCANVAHKVMAAEKKDDKTHRSSDLRVRHSQWRDEAVNSQWVVGLSLTASSCASCAARSYLGHSSWSCPGDSYRSRW